MTVNESKVIRNAAHGSGGAIFGEHMVINVDVNHSLIEQNTSGKDGGGICAELPTVRKSWIVSNAAKERGGGIYCNTAWILNSTVSQNSSDFGAGVYTSESESLTMARCLVSGNCARRRGGAVFRSGDYSIWDSVEFVNCTLVGNRAGETGGGIYWEFTSNVRLLNCILWNPGAELSGEPLQSLSVSHCCLQSGWERGVGNIDASPLFRDPSSGDYRLRDGSPCIDAGLDIGDPYNGQAPDIGAFEAPAEYAGGVREHVPTVLYVAGDATPGGDGSSWGKAFNEIRTALEVASTSDEIWVKSATYSESVVTEPNVNLWGGFGGGETSRGERDWMAHETVIDAGGSGGSALLATGSGSVDGFIITRGGAEQGGGVKFFRSSLKLENCSITDCTAEAGGAMSCVQSRPSLVNCFLVDNRAKEGGAILADQSFLDFTSCTIAGNSAESGSGGVFMTGSLLGATNSVFWNPGSELGGEWLDSATLAYSCFQGGFPGSGNIAAWPVFVGSGSGDYRLQNGSPCIDGGTDTGRPFNGAAPDIGAWEAPGDYVPGGGIQAPRTLFVAGDAPAGGDGLSWDSAFSRIGSALEVSGGSDEIWIKKGTYVESIHLEPGIRVLGGFLGNEENASERNWMANPTIIDASGLGTRAVVAEWDTTLDGVIVTGGWTTEPGGGIYCVPASSPRILNCTVTRNFSEVQGGGLSSGEGSPLIRNSWFIENRSMGNGGAIFVDAPGTAILERCLVFQNSAGSRGGGVFGGGAVVMESSTLAENIASGSGGGIYYENDTSPLIVRSSIIAGNEANEDGGGLFVGYASEGNFENTVIAGNRSYGAGGGGYSELLWIQNCWWEDDCIGWSCIPVYRCETVFYSKGSASFSNCILDENSPGGLGGQGFISVGWSRLQEDMSTGTENIFSDPRFVYPWDGQWGDFHLKETSPCVDAGNPDPAFDDACRPPGLGTILNDMGAYGGPYNCDGPPPIPTPEGDWTPQPTATPTMTPTPTETPTPTFSPTATMTPTPHPGDMTGDGFFDGKDLFFFSLCWEQSVNETNFRCDTTADGFINGEDLLELIRDWRETSFGP